jgi:predicted oxidoreductase (fatty acid repression mutant protein)
MSILETLLSGKSYIEIVKQFIGKVFTHEEKKFNHQPGDIVIMITKSKDGVLQIKTYSMIENTIVRTIPNKEAEQILMK